MRDYHRKTCEIRLRSESYDLLGTRSGEGEEEGSWYWMNRHVSMIKLEGESRWSSKIGRVVTIGKWWNWKWMKTSMGVRGGTGISPECGLLIFARGDWETKVWIWKTYWMSVQCPLQRTLLSQVTVITLGSIPWSTNTSLYPDRLCATDVFIVNGISK